MIYAVFVKVEHIRRDDIRKNADKINGIRKNYEDRNPFVLGQFKNVIRQDSNIYVHRKGCEISEDKITGRASEEHNFFSRKRSNVSLKQGAQKIENCGKENNPDEKKKSFILRAFRESSHVDCEQKNDKIHACTKAKINYPHRVYCKS